MKQLWIDYDPAKSEGFGALLREIGREASEQLLSRMIVMLQGKTHVRNSVMDELRGECTALEYLGLLSLYKGWASNVHWESKVNVYVAPEFIQVVRDYIKTL